MTESEFADFTPLDQHSLNHLLIEKQKPIDAVPTPLPKWNQQCRDFGGGIGLARGWHVTIGANTGSGKSILALNMAHSAIRHGESVGFISLEMSWEQLATRFMSIASGEKIRQLEPGSYLDPVVHNRAGRAIERIREQTGGRVFCNEQDISTLEDITGAILFLWERFGCRVAIVDYMQLADVLGAQNILDAVTQVSKQVRRTAKAHKLVTIGLSQLNREASKDYETSPTPQSLMGGSPLENDSDQVILLDHSRYSKRVASNGATQMLILGKNRHGGTGDIECEWNYDNLRISQIEDAGLEYRPDRHGEAWEAA